MRSKLFPNLQAQSISEKVGDKIKLLIYQGILKPGEKLPSERNLAEQFNVGRPAVREALKKLEAIELIEIYPNSGAFVRPLTAESFEAPLLRMIESEKENILEFLEVRKRLETWCVTEAARNATDEDLDRIGRIITEMEESQDMPESLKKADIEFHEAIVAATRNKVMMHLIRMFVTLMYSMKFVMELVYDPRNNEKILEQHRNIYESLRQRDPHRAREKTLQHIGYLISVFKTSPHYRKRLSGKSG